MRRMPTCVVCQRTEGWASDGILPCPAVIYGRRVTGIDRQHDQRLAPVRRLIKHLRGSLVTFHFYDASHFDDANRPPFVVRHKMVMFGEHDLFAILAMPDKAAAQAHNMAISAEPGLKTVDLVSIMPLEDA